LRTETISMLKMNHQLSFDKIEMILRFFNFNELEMLKMMQEKNINFEKNLKFIFEIPSKSVICFIENYERLICKLSYYKTTGEFVKSEILFDSGISDACVNESGTLLFLNNQEEIRKFTFNGESFESEVFHYFKGIVSSICINSDASLLCAVNDSTLLVFDLETEELIFKFEVYSSNICVTPLFSKFDPRILYFCDDHSIKIFSIPLHCELKFDVYQHLIQMIPLKFERLFDSQSYRSLCESSDGKFLYFGCKEGIFQYKLLRNEKLEMVRNLNKEMNIQFKFE
jgi:WD40 repeat protein